MASYQSTHSGLEVDNVTNQVINVAKSGNANKFVKIDSTGNLSTLALATVATSGSYNDLSNKPTIDNNNQKITGNSTAFGANDTINIVGSGATTVTADATNKKITISSTNTTYTADGLLSTLPTWTADPTDGVYLIRRDTAGAATFGQVTFLTVWNYIKSKISSVLGLTATNYGGKAATAGTADSATSATTATTATKLGSSTVGGTTTPIYLNSGTPTALGYTIAKSVPSDAKFTDTTYESKSAASGGTAVSLVTTGEKYTWNNKADAFSVTNGGPTLSWGTTSTVGTVKGTDLKVTMPANPNTDTKVTAVGNHYTPSGGTATTPSSSGTATRGSTVVMTGITKDAAGHVTGVTGYTLPASDNTDTKNTAGATDTSSKIFLVGATSLGANPLTYSDNQVYATNGQLDANKVRIGEHCTLLYNATTQALDFIFA